MFCQLSKKEFDKLVSNCKEIIDYLEKEIKPKLRFRKEFKFEMEPGTKPLYINLYPNSVKFISIFRATSYSIYPADISKDYYSRLYKENSIEEMLTLMNNWQYIKEVCLEQIKKDEITINAINTFKI